MRFKKQWMKGWEPNCKNPDVVFVKKNVCKWIQNIIHYTYKETEQQSHHILKDLIKVPWTLKNLGRKEGSSHNELSYYNLIISKALIDYRSAVFVHKLWSLKGYHPIRYSSQAKPINRWSTVINDTYKLLRMINLLFAFIFLWVPVRIDATFHEQAAKIASNLGKSAIYPLPQDLSLR